MSKTICIYHSIDLDGWMSAAIVKKWFLSNNKKVDNLPKVICNLYNETVAYHSTEDHLYMLGWNYGSEVPDLSEYDKVIMCDISFPKEEMIKIEDKLIWIDHHISAINDMKGTSLSSFVYGVKDSNGLRNHKFAACELTWKYFFGDDMPEIVRLLGRYDCFGHKGTDEETKVLEFQYGARQCISSYEEAYDWLIKTSNHPNSRLNLQVIWGNGKAIYAYLCTEAKWIYNMGKEIELEEQTSGFPNSVERINRKFLAINRSRFNPINFGIDYHADGYAGIMSFNYNKDKWTASLYNDNGEVDCSAIAKTLGGGGHKGASGFVMEDTTKFNNLLGI